MKKRTISILLLLAALGHGQAQAGTYNVSLSDNSPATTSGSYRWAIGQVNGDSQYPSTITFTTASNVELTSTVLPAITKPVIFSVGNASNNPLGTGNTPLTVNFTSTTTTINPRTILMTGGVAVSLQDQLLTLSMQGSTGNSSVLNSAGALVVTGDLGSKLINGSSTAASGATAYGMYAGATGATLSLSGNIKNTVDSSPIISVNAASSAYGLYSSSNMTIGDQVANTGGNIEGKISATATGATAYGLRSGAALSIYGNITSTSEITATATGSVYGLYSAGNLTLGNLDFNTGGKIDGKISATATTGGTAYGILGGTATSTTLDIFGGITGSVRQRRTTSLPPTIPTARFTASILEETSRSTIMEDRQASAAVCRQQRVSTWPMEFTPVM